MADLFNYNKNEALVIVNARKTHAQFPSSVK